MTESTITRAEFARQTTRMACSMSSAGYETLSGHGDLDAAIDPKDVARHTDRIRRELRDLDRSAGRLSASSEAPSEGGATAEALNLAGENAWNEQLLKVEAVNALLRRIVERVAAGEMSDAGHAALRDASHSALAVAKQAGADAPGQMELMIQLLRLLRPELNKVDSIYHIQKLVDEALVGRNFRPAGVALDTLLDASTRLTPHLEAMLHADQSKHHPDFPALVAHLIEAQSLARRIQASADGATET